MQYADVARWQHGRLDAPRLNAGLDYWTSQLAGLPDRLALPTDRSRPAVPTFDAAVHDTECPEALFETIQRLCRSLRLTPNMALLAGFVGLLARYSGQDDIAVGTPVANRHDTQAERLLGCFANTVVVRVTVRPGMTIRELLEEVRRTSLEAQRHQEIPFEQVVERVAPRRSASVTPVFQVMFAYQNAPWHAPRLHGLDVEVIDRAAIRGPLDLDLQVAVLGRRVRLSWRYNRDVFDAVRIEQMASHYIRVIEAMVADVDQVAGNISLVSADEMSARIAMGTAIADSIPQATLPELFEQQVACVPDAVAIVCGEQQWTYAEVSRRANGIARALASYGVASEDVVGIALDRSLDLIVAILGVLKAGAILSAARSRVSARPAAVHDRGCATFDHRDHEPGPPASSGRSSLPRAGRPGRPGEPRMRHRRR